ncbi:MAG: AAA family ATPase [Kiritimatiellae bacterium]|nr:AAA family ATPase [Kiritimatiellia bacterium]
MESTPEKPIPAKRLPLPVGNSDWSAVKAGYWSADKTQLISGLLDRKATVALFTRPRRFGKTFAIRMLRTFFEKTPESNAHLFEGTKVWADPAHRAEQGRYPVISITFKDAKGVDWKETLVKIGAAIRTEFERYGAAFESDNCAKAAKSLFQDIQDRTKTPPDLDSSLGILASTLHSAHGERPVILIDEYDSPINWAATHGFGEEALPFFRNFLSGAMKDGDHCRLGVITGILRVAKEGVLSGLNNIKVYSVFERDFADCFGFTEEEVRGMLATYGHPEKMDEAKGWYDGYRFGDTEIYNPWSLLNYVDDGFRPRPYWTSTSSNDLVTDVLSRMTPKMRDSLADFFEKGECLVPCPGDLGPYGTIQNEPRRIWPLLVHTGYLKVLAGPDDNDQAKLAFPNKELRRVFRDEILNPMCRVPTIGDDLQDILASLTRGDAEKFRRAIEAFLVSSASYFDMAHEDFFHGLVLGILALGGNHYEIKSNRESGDGRPDIAMKPRPGVTLPGVILEFKAPKLDSGASPETIEAALAVAAREARNQIDEKRYAAEMEATGIAVLKYGVAFAGKRVSLAK